MPSEFDDYSEAAKRAKRAQAAKASRARIEGEKKSNKPTTKTVTEGTAEHTTKGYDRRGNTDAKPTVVEKQPRMIKDPKTGNYKKNPLFKMSEEELAERKRLADERERLRKVKKK